MVSKADLFCRIYADAECVIDQICLSMKQRIIQKDSKKYRMKAITLYILHLFFVYACSAVQFISLEHVNIPTDLGFVNDFDHDVWTPPIPSP